MKTKVLIAHAKGEEELAEQLAEPIRAAGYEVAHEGTVLVGESVVAEASKLLSEGVPVVFCGTVRAIGTKWGKQVVNAARLHVGVRIFVVQMEEDADVDGIAFDETIARHWQDNNKAEQALIAALLKHYPLDRDPQQNLRVHDLESRYRALALKACDIIDLANLPEDDRHLASRELELRRLYVALRMRLEIQAGDEADDNTLAALEKRRTVMWGDGESGDSDENNRTSLGERLQAVKRLVVLGDPGAGKSTLLRWLATAYLLRLQNDPNWRDLPDIATLPDEGWLPILVRCRDLPADANTLDDMLFHSLRKSELAENECHELRELLRSKLTDGTALLLVDGLDEITEPTARSRFSQQLEQIHRAFPNAPIVVTSRIVGYREMGYRIRSGFEHLTVADLSKQDKDDFARRWCALTEPVDRRDTAAAELIHDIHSLDRIERLTGNPMLLTTMALIKRKIGRLPQQRVDLYEKAVEVLLNWRSAVDVPLDSREALPQLEYLAHAMCADGIQQLREDQVLELLHQVRKDYPQIHPLSQHSPEEFLCLLERRTGLLIQSGLIRHNGHSVPVYEFRHLTFQEYLAGIALVQGHYRERDKDKSLADVIAPLAGLVKETESNPFGKKETAVVENWREALRLCLASCNDDVVDAALLAILNPLSGESSTERPRAVLAGLCLADEPNVSDMVAQEVLQTLVVQVGEIDGDEINSSLEAAVMELAASRWLTLLGEYLLDEFFRPDVEQRFNSGSLYASIQERQAPQNETEFSAWLSDLAVRLSDNSEREAAATALTIMQQAFRGKNCQVAEMANALNQRLSGSKPLGHAVAWSLCWMSHEKHGEQTWHPDQAQLERLFLTLENPYCDSGTVRCLSVIFKNNPTPQAVDALLMHLQGSADNTTRRIITEALGAIGDTRAIDELLARLQDIKEDQTIRQAAIKALGEIGGIRVLECLKTYYQNADENLRRAALQGLAQSCEDEIDRRLLSEDLDDSYPWLDPLSPITEDQIANAAARLKKPLPEIQQRYAALAERFGLTLA
jgi:GTPase SAR1 family protein